MSTPKPKTVTELYPSPWLCTDDLRGRSVTVTVIRCTVETVRSSISKQDEQVAILGFGRTKRLILNKTQCLAMAQITGSERFQDWHGHTITLTPARAPNGKPTIAIHAHETPASAGSGVGGGEGEN